MYEHHSPSTILLKLIFSFHTHFSSSLILKSHHTDNKIDSDGAKAISEALKVNSSITNMDLRGILPIIIIFYICITFIDSLILLIFYIFVQLRKSTWFFVCVCDRM